RAPRRRRAIQQARLRLQQGEWDEALHIIQGFEGRGQNELRSLEGECHHQAAEASLKEQRFEDALAESLQAAQLFESDSDKARFHVLDAMLAEVRRLFASGGGTKGTDAVHKLVERILRVQSPCAEASFWEGLCHLRDGRTALAPDALRAAHEAGGKLFVEPPLYLGALLVREGPHQEGPRFL